MNRVDEFMKKGEIIFLCWGAYINVEQQEARVWFNQLLCFVFQRCLVFPRALHMQMNTAYGFPWRQ